MKWIPKNVPWPAPATILPLAAMLVCAGALGAILVALAFQYIGGYEPCPLCYKQRWAYYFAIPLAGAAAMAALYENRDVPMLALTLCAAGFAVNAVFGGFHAGVEWHLWPGPADCTGGDLTAPAGDLFAKLGETRVVRCDEASWRFLGISFAGYNALISAGLAIVAFAGTWFGRAREQA